jgi:hypothetical protein
MYANPRVKDADKAIQIQEFKRQILRLYKPKSLRGRY